MDNLPTIGITMGDPSGVGPEIIGKALAMDDIYKICKPVVLGDINALRMASQQTSAVHFHLMDDPMEVMGRHGVIDVISVSNLSRKSFMPGMPTVDGGKAMVEYIVEAVNLAKIGKVSAMVTCPINKELMHMAGFRFDGHTEFLAKLTDTLDYVMMLAGKRLKVSLVTIHCPLKEVPNRLKKETIVKTISITCNTLERDFSIKSPRIAVSALNPHGGESGLFGTEESDIIQPAIEECRRQGMLVEGPFPPDTIFYHAVNGKCDAVVAMYHDQGLIPFKLLHFSDGVNITLGLPIIRTSVDHGTAYDIAGKGEANPSSLVAAIKMAAEMSKDRDKAEGSELL